MTIKHYILILLLFCTSGLLAQDARFSASVSKNQVGTGEQFEVDFTLNANGDKFTPPNFSGFQLLSGPNESTSMTSINGNTTSSVSIGYILMAEKEGAYTIGSASVIVNGKQLVTNAIKIKVVKGQPARQNNNQAQSGPDNSVSANPSADISKQVFIKAVVDKTHVYQGEQISLIYKLYTQVNLSATGDDKSPDLNGFWSQDMVNKNQNVAWATETYKGQRYRVAELRRTILFPEHSGDLTIDPLSMSFVAQQPRAPRDIMEQMFGGGYTEVKVKAASTPVIIHVKPLPEDGKPAGFTGAVGSFSVDASIDKNELKANEALNYKLKITGSGNIKLLKDANINPPADFEKYDPKITDTISQTVNGISGSRILTYLLIPRHEGNYTIDPVQFSYFNPATNRYVTLTTKAFNIKVDKGMASGNVTSLAPADKQDIKLLNKDIRYIKTSGIDLYNEGETFYGSAGYYLLLCVGPLLFLAAFAYRRWNEENNSDIVKVKSRMANKIASKHMANAQTQLAAGNTKAFYEAVSKGLYGYLSDKLNIPAANLNQENIAVELKARLLDDELIQKLFSTLDLCEMARFAPASGVSQQEVFDGAKNTINDIETKI
jgi:hypothetical protein